MAKKGIFRRFAETITAPVKKATTAVTDSVKGAGSVVKRTVTKPFTKKPKPAKKPAAKKPAPPVPPPPKPAPAVLPKPRPTPAVAREQLHQKMHDMFWLQKKWDAAAMSRRITRMTDDQVYAALDMTENDIDSAVRIEPTEESMWADPTDSDINILWYHGGETMIG